MGHKLSCTVLTTSVLRKVSAWYETGVFWANIAHFTSNVKALHCKWVQTNYRQATSSLCSFWRKEYATTLKISKFKIYTQISFIFIDRAWTTIKLQKKNCQLLALFICCNFNRYNMYVEFTRRIQWKVLEQ